MKGQTMFADGGILTRAASVTILAMVFGLTAHAYEFAGGTGEPDDPYQLATIEDLLAIGSSRESLTKHYVLVNDLDLDPNLPGGRLFEDALIAPDGYEGVSGHAGDGFSGVLDGQGHAIRNLWISGKHGYDAGLFGQISGLVKDLRLQDVRISGSPCGAMAGFSNARSVILRCSVTGQVRGSGDTGGMVGVCWDGILMDCLAEVQVTGVKNVGGMVGGGPGAMLLRCESRGSTSGDSYVGGLIGELRQGQIVDSRAEGFVTGRDRVGGLVGSLAMAGSIMRSVADCEVTAEQTAGGLAGSAVRFAAHGQMISDCYAHGVVAGAVAGGLIGEASDVRVLNSYAACEMIPMKAQAGAVVAAVGGLLGEADVKAPPLVDGCFWDVSLSGTPVGTGSGPIYGTGLPTEQMQQQATFEQAGWDFDSVWTMEEGEYPKLQWEPAAN